MALLGSGFDPGMTNVYTAYAKKHHFDQIDTLDIVDCNAGNHGKAFATNFNPEINIREITQMVVTTKMASCGISPVYASNNKLS
jgi:saccharopine dehydrogenase (NAD+, L-lysine-forming)